MRRPISNPPNPYESTLREWLEPPPAARLHVYEEHARSIVSENDSPDLSFRYSVNPYRGCQHACAYCYARPTHEYLGLGAGTDFDTHITVKVNAAELLARELDRPRWRRDTIAFSGVTDCYQPLEAVYGVTRACLEVCLRKRNPVGVVTKSYLIVRDAELLAELTRRVRVMVYVSIPFADERLSRAVEPHAPPPARRFAAVAALAAAGVPVCVLVSPLIPGLNDLDVPRILSAAADAGARNAGYSALRLPGSVKDVFLTRLREALPDRAARVEALVRQMRGGALNNSAFGERMRGVGTQWEAVRQLFRQSCRRLGLNSEVRLAVDPPEAEPTAPRFVQLEMFKPDSDKTNC